jgi:hypothetical protein
MKRILLTLVIAAFAMALVFGCTKKESAETDKPPVEVQEAEAMDSTMMDSAVMDSAAIEESAGDSM